MHRAGLRMSVCLFAVGFPGPPLFLWNLYYSPATPAPTVEDPGSDSPDQDQNHLKKLDQDPILNKNWIQIRPSRKTGSGTDRVFRPNPDLKCQPYRKTGVAPCFSKLPAHWSVL